MSYTERRKFLGLTGPAWIGVGVTLGLLIWLLYFLINLGPRKVEDIRAPVEINGGQARASREIDEVEQAYRNLPTEGEPPAGMEDRLARAISLQEQLIQVAPDATGAEALRLDRLLVARDTLRARRIWPQVEALETKLAGLQTESGKAGIMAELLALRREINRSRAAARYKDIVRVTQLQREYESIQAEPLREQADAALAEAQQAAKAENWAVALENYTRARETMDTVNQEYARTRFADIALRSRLRAEEVSLQGAAEAAEVALFMQGGDEASRDQPDAAAGYYQKAADMQKLLNERWPKSRFFSTTLPDQIEEKRQTVLAGQLVGRIKTADAEVNGLLAARRILVAREQITAVLAQTKRLAEELPRSRISDGGLTRKYTFLESLGGELRGLQDDVYAQLVPLPNRASILLLNREVSQGLYTRVMRFNPSREQGDDRPVESLSWGDAREFCQRLSWILGLRVRLPAEEEMRSALSDANSYSALRDGVGEWLTAEDAANDAPVFAPTAKDEAAARLMGKDTRSRDIGFRIVVETGAN